MSYESLTQKIWRHPDCLLIIFAGSSAEFALSPRVDWLFYTGRLPGDPIERMFSTIAYSQRVLFADTREKQMQLTHQVQNIHAALEQKRGQTLEPKDYRDVLLMTTAYTLKAYELVFGRALTPTQSTDIICEIAHAWRGMKLENTAEDYETFLDLRRDMFSRFVYSEWTPKLLQSYERILGQRGDLFLRLIYQELLDAEILRLLSIQPSSVSWALKPFFFASCHTGFIRILYRLFFPSRLAAMFNQFDNLSRLPELTA
jgi:hypothetical protein